MQRIAIVLGAAFVLLTPAASFAGKKGSPSKSANTCLDTDHCPPPGTCSQSQYDALVDKKEAACNQARSCARPRPKQDCDVYKANIGRNGDCISARNAVMKCFKGGDARHRNERDNVVRVLNDCKKHLSDAKAQRFCK